MQHDFTLTPNGSQTIDVAGRFFKYKTGNGLIRVRTTKGGFIDLLPGQGVENETFTSLTVQDKTGLANAGSILAGDFNFRDERISGDVSVIDNAKARSVAATAFAMTLYQAGAAAQNATCQLFNPIGSGKFITVSHAYISSAVSALVRIGTGNAIIGSVVPNIAAPKKAGAGTVGISQASGALMTVDPSGFKFLSWNYVQANQSFEFKLQEPVILMPGYGFYVQNMAGNADLTLSVEYTEDSI